jgi:hypothetical protein
LADAICDSSKRFVHKISMRIFCFVSASFLIFSTCFGQYKHFRNTSKIAIVPKLKSGVFVPSMENHFTVVSTQIKPVTLDQINVFSAAGSTLLNELKVQSTGTSEFMVVPDAEFPTIGFVVQLEDFTDTAFFSNALPDLQASIGLALLDGEIDREQLSNRAYLMVYINCCGFDAKLPIVEFEVMRLAQGGKYFISKNIGGKFEEDALELLKHAQSGDEYIFRDILVKYPGATEPILCGSTLRYRIR